MNKDVLADHMTERISSLENKTDNTKNTILRTIDEIRTQILEERSSNTALRKELEATKKLLKDKETETQTKFAAMEKERSKIVAEMKLEMDKLSDAESGLAEITRQKEEAVKENSDLSQKYKTLEAELHLLREQNKALDEIQQALFDTKLSLRSVM